MRQPEIARAATVFCVWLASRAGHAAAPRFLVALLLVLPLARPARDLVVAALFLGEFLTAGAWPGLSRVTPPPAREPLPVAGAVADRYSTVSRSPRAPGALRLRTPSVSGSPHAPGALRLRTATSGGGGVPLVLVHGLAPDGKDDPRLRDAAALLARAGFDVAVPTVPGLTRLRLRPEDVAPVVATLGARQEPAVVVGVSVGAGVALLAATDVAVRERIRLVLSLGGYASAAELIRFYLTGEYAWRDQRGRVVHDPALIQLFLAANGDLLDASARRVLGAADAAELSASLSALSPPLRGLLDTLSPERAVAGLRAPLVLVHGRDDTAVPYTESLRLAAARPAATDVVLVGVVSHVEGRSAPGALRDLLALWRVTYRLVALA